MESEFRRKYIKEESLGITTGIKVPETLLYLAFLVYKLYWEGEVTILASCFAFYVH